MLASIEFRRFKALRHTRVDLAPFNLIIGPNGSGKTSLIEAIARLASLSQLPPQPRDGPPPRAEGPELEFRFAEPYAGVSAQLSCVSETVCDTLRLSPPQLAHWPEIRAELATIRSYVLDHAAMARPSRRDDGFELRADGGNLAANLADMRARAPDSFAALTAELLRMLPEFGALRVDVRPDGTAEFGLELSEDGVVAADEMSQGILYLVGVLALAFDPDPPRVLCIEEIDRGIHPRMLREVRDALYRLSYPESFGLQRRAVQIVTTTHSPYFIDLFRDHPEEVIVSHKHGRAARFERLTDRPDLPELLRDGSLGDMWFSGILGGVPEER